MYHRHIGYVPPANHDFTDNILSQVVASIKHNLLGKTMTIMLLTPIGSTLAE